MADSDQLINSVHDNVVTGSVNGIQAVAEPSIGGNGGIMHNHGANFGRYVVGCPACIKKYPDGPPERRKRAKPGHKFEEKTEANSDTEKMPTMQSQMATRATIAHPITGSDLIEAIKALQGDQKEALIAMAQELRKPDADVVAEKAEAKERKERNRQDMIQMEEDRVALQRAKQAVCEQHGHKKENGRTAISGQVHNDGLFHGLCIHCFKEFPGVKPTHENMPTGVSVI